MNHSELTITHGKSTLGRVINLADMYYDFGIYCQRTMIFQNGYLTGRIILCHTCQLTFVQSSLFITLHCIFQNGVLTGRIILCHTCQLTFVQSSLFITLHGIFSNFSCDLVPLNVIKSRKRRKRNTFP